MIDRSTPLRVLILEDNPDHAELLVRELKHANFDPDWRLVATEEAYLAHLAPDLDVILSDYSMPRFEALRALRLLREHGLDIPFIIISGTIDEATAVAAMQAGAADYLLKDRLGRLGSAVTRVLENRQLLDERKQIDRQLRRAEKQLANILEHAAESIVAVNENHQVIVFNKAAEKTFGYSSQEALGQPLDILIPDRIVKAHRQHVRNFAASSERSRPIEHRQGLVAKRKDGTFFPVEIGLSKLETDDGIIFTAMIVDITERQRAEERVQQMQNRFRALTENAPDGVALIESDGRMKYISPAGRRMFGYSTDENPDIDPAEYTHPDDLPVVLAAFTQIIENPKQNPTLQYRFKHRDGSWMWIESTFTNLLNVKNVEAIVINFRDITERRQAERALLRSERRYWALFENTPIAIWEEDFSGIKRHLEGLKQGGVTDFRAYFTAHPEAVYECIAMIRILDVNKAAVQMYQAESKEALLEGMHQLLSKGEWKNYCADLICIAEGGTSNSWVGSEETLTDKGIEVSLNWLVAPDHEEDFSKVIVTTIDITEGKRSEERIQQQLRRLTILRNIDQAIAESTGRRFVLTTVLEHVKSELDVDAVVILLYDADEQRLKYEIGLGMRTDALKYTRLGLGDGYAGRAALARETVFIPDLQTRKTDFLRSPTFSQEGFVCYFGVPLIAKGEVEGVMEIFYRSPREPEQEWLDFMETLAGQVAIAIDNATLYEGLQRATLELAMAYDATIEGWSKALDLRDKETEGHTKRVTEMSIWLARAIGVDEEKILHIKRGGLLHDIGKMGVPDSILLKPDKLTKEEWEIMRKHPVFAYEMLSPITYLRPALDIPYCHHEKWDGTGYPRNLKGEEIPLSARIFAVVDVWDALTSDRPYRLAWTKERAFNYVKEQSGKHFDPQVVSAFLDLI